MKKVVLITGAGTGIGRATAELFAYKGWQVVATMRDPAKYEDYYVGENYYLAELDVTRPASIRVTLDQIRKLYNRLDVVINNAGYGLYGAFEVFTPEEVQQQYDVNVFGTMNMCREVLPWMREQGSGAIVNVSSMGGKFTVPYYSVYNSTKFAVEGFSEGLFYEVEPFGIRVKVVEPGAIDTDFYNRSMKTGSRETEADAYKTTQDALWQYYSSAGKRGSKAAAVAKVIYKAAKSKSSRLRYAAGTDAHLNIWAYKFLPHQIAMWFAKRATLNRV